MDVASFVIGTSGLIAVLDKVLALGRVYHDVKSFPSDVADLICKFQVQERYLYIWKLEVIFHQENQAADDQSVERTTQATQPSLLATQLCEQLSTTAQGILRASEDAREIIGKYLLQDQISTAEDFSIAAALSSATEVLGTRGNNLLKPANRPRWQESVLKNLGIRRKLAAVTKPWATPDKQKLEEAIGRLQNWNNELFRILSILIHRKITDIRSEVSALSMKESGEDVTSLRILEATAQDNSDDDTARSAALAIQVCELNASEMDRKEKHLYAIKWIDLTMKDGVKGCSGALASTSTTPDDKVRRQIDVHVEWLDYSGLSDPQTEIASSRIGNLCHLLNANKPEKLPTLRSRGYVQDRFSRKFGIVFELPSGEKPTSLHHLLLSSRRKTDGSKFRLTLDQRFALARRLCWAFLELHKARWLHRGFNSSCVLFSTNSSFATEENNTASSRAALLEVGLSTIGGFQYARPVGLDQVSLPVGTTTQETFAMYHHPAIRANLDRDPDVPYTKYLARHDVYSLGVVLLEIGMETAISELKTQGTPKRFAERLSHIAKTQLQLNMGKSYADIVCRCLDGAGEMDFGGAGEAEMHIPWMLWEIVQPMQYCHCGFRV